MKSAKYIFVPFVLLMLFSCKKDDLQIYKLEIKSETFFKSNTSAIIVVEYEYPASLESVEGFVSASSDMSGATSTAASVNENVFTVNFQNLESGTTYYYQYEYSNGVDLIKTEVESFTTNDYGLPTVTTSDVSDITATSATCGGSVTDDGGSTVTARGVCWSTSHTPTINDAHTTDGSGTGNYTSYMTNMSSNTTYYVRAYATNVKGTSYGEQKAFTTTYGLPTVTTNDVTNITATSATCGGSVTDDGGAAVTARGVCWSTSPNPTINDLHTTNGTGIGTFSSNISGFTTSTTYYVRAYATNSKGTSYGEQKVFKTTDGLPVVTTNDVTDITATSATCGGNVTDDGGAAVTARGVCWSTSPNPMVNDLHTTNGTGIGTFSSNISGFTTSTTYYVRAYATNNKGTSYGEQKTFTTYGLPTVTTNDVTNITATSATCGGSVTDDGGAAVTARGVCWSTSPNPTINDLHTTNGTGIGTFSSNISGFTTSTTYYVRAYATNSKGTSYGEQKTFKTLVVTP